MGTMLRAAYHETPWGQAQDLFDEKVGSRLTPLKQKLINAIETPQPQMNPTAPKGVVGQAVDDAVGTVLPNPETIQNVGVPAAQAVTSTLASQLPTTSGDVAQLAALDIGIPAVTKLAPKIFPVLGRDVGPAISKIFGRGPEGSPKPPADATPEPPAEAAAPVEPVDKPPSLRAEETAAPEDLPPSLAQTEPAVPPESYQAWEQNVQPEQLDVIAKARQVRDSQPPTADLHTHPETGEYTQEREILHREIESDPHYHDPAGRAPEGTQPVARIVIGLPASGKTSGLESLIGPEAAKSSILMDNDRIKERLPEYNGANAGSLHAESSYIEHKILRRLVDERYNITHTVVGKTEKNVKGLIDLYKKNGYRVELYHMDVHPHTAATRAMNRFAETGRFVDPRYIIDEVGLKPKQTYDRLKTEVDAYGQASTEVPPGSPPRLLEQAERSRRSRAGIPDSSTAGLPGSEASREETQGSLNPPVEPQLEKLFPKPKSGETGAVTLGSESVRPDVYGREYTKWDEAQRALIDRNHVIKYKPGAEIAPAFESAGGKYTESYVAASTFTGKARGAWETAFQDRNEILKPLKNAADREVFNKVAWMRHFIDLDRLGKTTSGVTAEAAQTELVRLRAAIGPERFDRIARVANDFTKWYSQARLKMMVQGKLITPETAETLQARYPNYIPTEILDSEMKKIDSIYEPLQPLGRVKAGFLKTKKGTTANVNTDVLDVTSRGFAQVAMAAEKQKVIDKIADEFGTTIGRREFQDGQMVTRVNPKNIPPGWIRSNVKVSDGRVIAVSPQVDRLLRGLDVESMDMVTTAMSKYNAIFRHSATAWRTAFGLGHVVRAFESALINRRPIAGEAAFLPSILKGISSAVKESLGIPDELYREWITGGGGFGGLASSVKASSTQKIPFRLLSGHEQLLRVAEAPLEALGRMTRVSDNVIRLAEYARLKPTQLPEALKILQSRRVPIDFEKYGDAMRVMNRWVPFVNDKVQADVNALQIAQHHPMLTIGRLTAYAAAPAAALYAYNHRDQATRDLDEMVPERFKEQNFYVHTGMKTSDGNPIVIAVPKKGPIAMVSNMVEGLMEKANKDPAFEQRLKDYTATAETQKMASMLLPPAFRAPLEQAFNVDMYSGRPIVNDRLKNVSPRYQFNPGTSNTARFIGEKTGISPVRLEAGARSIFPASSQILQGSSSMFKKSVPVPRQERDSIYSAQAFEPFVKVPAVHYNLDEERARDYNQSNDQAGRTPAFMLNQAYSQYLRDQTPDNLRLLQDWAAKTPRDQRVRAMQQARRDYINQQLSSGERARRQVPLKRRGRFSAETGVGMP